jgi:ABC-type polar amino acid transport system ATPase subunit
MLDEQVAPPYTAGARIDRGASTTRESGLATLRIEQHRDACPGRLSGVERQRVAKLSKLGDVPGRAPAAG